MPAEGLLWKSVLQRETPAKELEPTTSNRLGGIYEVGGEHWVG
jgi:hypothetical protein